MLYKMQYFDEPPIILQAPSKYTNTQMNENSRQGNTTLQLKKDGKMIWISNNLFAI
jgi:hypothetical protein